PSIATASPKMLSAVTVSGWILLWVCGSESGSTAVLSLCCVAKSGAALNPIKTPITIADNRMADSHTVSWPFSAVLDLSMELHPRGYIYNPPHNVAGVAG